MDPALVIDYRDLQGGRIRGAMAEHAIGIDLDDPGCPDFRGKWFSHTQHSYADILDAIRARVPN